ATNTNNSLSLSHGLNIKFGMLKKQINGRRNNIDTILKNKFKRMEERADQPTGQPIRPGYY
uniref:Uncharacterized protein n=1 Tax=Aegilops tauschii subsp. strangulata TaxID=200361 RepID=A0A453SV47_AEGTS